LEYLRKIFVARVRFNSFNTLIERFNISFYNVGYQSKIIDIKNAQLYKEVSELLR